MILRLIRGFLVGNQSSGSVLVNFVLNEFLPYQLSVLSTRISRDFSAHYRERFGISVAEWRVVAHLSQIDGPVSVREIYQRVEMEKSKVSRAASRLEARGFLKKAVDKNDRRLVELSLTQSGNAMMSELAVIAEAFQKTYLARLYGKETEFRLALETLLAHKGA